MKIKLKIGAEPTTKQGDWVWVAFGRYDKSPAGENFTVRMQGLQPYATPPQAINAGITRLDQRYGFSFEVEPHD